MEKILEFCAATNTTVGNMLFRKRAICLVTYEFGPSKTQVDYRFVRRNQRKIFKDTKVISH